MTDARPLITSVHVERQGAHDVLRVWNRGGFAGELVLAQGDGAELAVRLFGGPERVERDAVYGESDGETLTMAAPR